MKSNAPERIWIDPTNDLPKLCGHIDKDSVEYVRKDAFIEKAVKFMEKINDVDEYSWYNEEEHASGITEKCIEDFKKYMEDKI